MPTHKTYFLHALTPLHPGTGQGIGLIDLPIQRERSTGIPLVPGSSVRGVLRDAYRRAHDPSAQGASSPASGGQDAGQGGEDEPPPSWRLFGPDHANAHQFASALRVSDARTLLFPVPSDTGTFAWVTCPAVLARLVRDHGDLADQPPPVPQVPERGACRVAPGCAVVSGRKGRQRAVLDGLPFQVQDETDDKGGAAEVARLGKLLAGRLFPGQDHPAPWWREHLVSHLVVVADDLFAWFTQSATDVRAHIRIDEEKGTVAKGALWYEETLPPETVLAGVMQIEDNGRLGALGGAKAAWGHLAKLVSEPIQVGGRASVGEGLVRLVL